MSIAPFSPKQGDTHFNPMTGEMQIFDGQQWISIISGLQGVSGPFGVQSISGPVGPTGSPGPTITVGPIPATTTTPRIPRPEWEPCFAVWPKRTISGKLRVGPLMKRTQRYTEYTDFSSAERITITSYATKKEAFVWKMKHNG